MKILLIEDESLAAEKLKSLILDINPEADILAIIDSVDGAIDWFKNNSCPNLVITDIHLADGLCFNIFSEISTQCPIIFATAYDKYAIQAFEVNSIDYLLKPVQKERLEQALNKYTQLNQSQNTEQAGLYAEFQKILSQQNKNYKTRFLCKLGNKIKSIPTENIAYFYSQDKMTFIVDKNNQRLPVNNTLDEIDQMIDPSSFFRLNRKYISNFEAIAEIHPYFKGRLKLRLNPGTADDIVVSTEKSPLFKAWLDR